MEKKEALNKITIYMDMIKGAGPFKGRTKALNSLKMLFDLVDRYKPSGNYYEVCVKEAQRVVNTLTEELDNAG